VGPVQGPAQNLIDLLAVWRTTGGILWELPDLVIWRIHIKISINWKFSVANAAANTGVFYALFVDSINQVMLESSTHPYDEQYLMWSNMFVSEFMSQGGISGTVDTTNQHNMYKYVDVRSHRKLKNQLETLYLSLTGTGNMAIQDYAITQSTLLRLP